MKDLPKDAPIRVQMLAGVFKDKQGGKSMFNKERYQFAVDSPFLISDQCCRIMKKTPAHEYAKETGRNPMTAQMASESKIRTQKWLMNGCNGFNLKQPTSNPMSFWNEQDVLLYIKMNHIPIASVYGEIVAEEDGYIVPDEMLQMYADAEMLDYDLCLRTTGCRRTGCIFCLFGIQSEKEPNRLQQLKESHPKMYEWMMKPEEEGGLGYKDKIDWINEHGNFHIKY